MLKKYKYIWKRKGKDQFRAQLSISGKTWNSRYFSTEREAAVAADIKLVELGREPVNVLIRKV